MIRLLLLIAIAVGIGAPIFLSARDRARQSAATRARLMLGGAVGVAAGLLAGFWLPHQIRGTHGSPASLVVVLVLWIIGGGFAFLSAALLAGAVYGRGPRDDPSS